MTRPVSLGLLPSGPDPVGEWLVHRQPPALYIGRSGGEGKRSRKFRIIVPQIGGDSR
jgi:hypothetical protein